MNTLCFNVSIFMLQFLPPLPDMSREVSDSEDDVTAELDEAVPQHSLLSSQGARHKAELAHKGVLATRSRPSLEGMKTQLSGSSLPDTDLGVEVTVTSPAVTTVELVSSPVLQPASAQAETNGMARNQQSFQDQLRSKLEARKRSLEGEQTETNNTFHLPLSESKPTNFKGGNGGRRGGRCH